MSRRSWGLPTRSFTSVLVSRSNACNPSRRERGCARDSGQGAAQQGEQPLDEVSLLSSLLFPLTPPPPPRGVRQLRTADVVAAEIEGPSLNALAEIEALYPGKGGYAQFRQDVYDYQHGTFTGLVTPEMRDVARQLDEAIYKPIGEQFYAAGGTVERKGKMERFERKDRFAPEYYDPDPDAPFRTGNLTDPRAGSVDPTAHERVGGGRGIPVRDAFDAARRYIPDMARRTGLAAGFGPVIKAGGRDIERIGVRGQELLIRAAKSGLDPSGAKVFADALQEAYFPTVISPGDGAVGRVQGSVLLGRNPLAVPPDLRGTRRHHACIVRRGAHPRWARPQLPPGLRGQHAGQLPELGRVGASGSGGDARPDDRRLRVDATPPLSRRVWCPRSSV